MYFKITKAELTELLHPISIGAENKSGPKYTFTRYRIMMPNGKIRIELETFNEGDWNKKILNRYAHVVVEKRMASNIDYHNPIMDELLRQYGSVSHEGNSAYVRILTQTWIKSKEQLIEVLKAANWKLKGTGGIMAI